MITFFASAMALAMAGCSADGPETAAQYPLERFTLQVGANIYHANIDQEAGTVTVGQIKYGGQVTAVGCYLADGAQISPNPQNFVGDWPERQEFTVTSGGKETVYTVILSAYEGKFPGAQGEIIFFDDFDQADGLDMNSWDYVPKGTAAWQVSMSGSPDQSYVKDGNLVLVVDRKDGVSLTGGVKTQGKIWFQGNFRVDVCARFVDDGPTVGQAIWMMPEPAYQVYQGWPDGGEIDIMEHSYGHDYVQHTLHSHYIDTYTGHNTDHVDLEYSGWDTGYNAGQYNVYSVEITDDEIVMYCNEVERLRYANMKLDNEADLKQWPFSGGYYLILSVGPAGRNEISDDDVPSYMEVDWVRVSRLD